MIRSRASLNPTMYLDGRYFGFGMQGREGAAPPYAYVHGNRPAGSEGADRSAVRLLTISLCLD